RVDHGTICGRSRTNSEQYKPPCACVNRTFMNVRAAQGRARIFFQVASVGLEPALMEYEIQPADVKGPFNKTIPQSFEKKAELKTLNFTSPRELLSEKFHIDAALLSRLNPKSSFDQAGTKIMVLNVERKPSQAKVGKVVV